MDIPILKYVDILVGLAVIMILVSTVVAAASQLILQSTYARARALRGGLQEIIANLDKSLVADAQYFAERLLRHPMIGRPNWLPNLPGEVRNLLRSELHGRLPLPPMNPGSVVLREEFFTMLLEWAADQGPLRAQDRVLFPGEASGAKKFELLAAAFRENGIASPAEKLEEIRKLVIENEQAHPEWPATRWRSDAILKAAGSPALAKINGWFDGMSQRVTQQFAFQARIYTTIVALLVCAVIQLDSFALLRRLSVDDKFRDSLVTQAQELQRQRDSAEGAQKTAVTSEEKAARQNESDSASEQLRDIQQTLAQLREPKLQVIPPYLAWEKLQMAEVAVTGDLAAPVDISVGPSSYPIASAGAILSVAQLHESISRSGAPVDMYLRDGKLILVARTAGSGKIELKTAGIPKSTALAQINWYGLKAKSAGIFLSWILVSLGAPFWYDLLKNALNLRSLMARKEDADRIARQSEGSASGAAGKA